MEINDIVTLNDNVKYLVCEKVNYQGITYIYLVDIINKENSKIIYVENEEFFHLIEKDIINKVLKLIIKKNFHFYNFYKKN